MKITDKHVLFFSYKDMFSNHFRSERPFFSPRHERDGVKFYTGEHFMMYEKAKLFGDEEISKKILETFHPQEAKKLGRLVKGFNNDVWEYHREDIIFSIVYCRLVYDQHLRLSALNHRMDGRSFVEASPWDKIYGIGLKETDPACG
ncbi:hypothetical protein [Acinetobacter phage ABPH49]|nr:hypothetical protein [Acinetobacter phage ABPH49]